MLTSVPDEAASTAGRRNSVLDPGTLRLPRGALAGGLAHVSSSRSSRGPRDLRGRLHDLLRFGIPEARGLQEVAVGSRCDEDQARVRLMGPLRRPRDVAVEP